MTNSADPDQLVSSGSTLSAKTGHVVFSLRRVNAELANKVVKAKRTRYTKW